MSKDAEKKPAPAQQQPQLKVATQKTFVFPRRTNPAHIDAVINKWLKEQALKGCPAMIGKIYGERRWFSSKIYFQYLYSTVVNLPAKNEGPVN